MAWRFSKIQVSHPALHRRHTALDVALQVARQTMQTGQPHRLCFAGCIMSFYSAEVLERRKPAWPGFSPPNPTWLDQFDLNARGREMESEGIVQSRG